MKHKIVLPVASYYESIKVVILDRARIIKQYQSLLLGNMGFLNSSITLSTSLGPILLNA
jgi:hypothetical protein